MGRSRNLSKLLVDANGDVDAASLDNVPPSDDASALTTGTLDIARIADGAVTAGKLASTLDLTGKTVTLPAGVGGKVLQVVQTVMDTDIAVNVTSFTDISGMSATITPQSTSSKILISCVLHYGQGASTNGDDFVINLITTRNGTALSYNSNSNRGYGDVAFYKGGWDTLTMGIAKFERLDSPSSTSALTYQIQIKTGDLSTWGNNPVYINRASRFDNAFYAQSRARSTLTLWEIAG
jgi:hypothetical protein